jgi:hypothetical protein
METLFNAPALCANAAGIDASSTVKTLFRQRKEQVPYVFAKDGEVRSIRRDGLLS